MTFSVTGAVFNYLVHWNSTYLDVTNANFYANGNANAGNGNACGMFVSGEVLTGTNSQFEFSNNGIASGKSASGFWADGDANYDAVFNITGGSFKIDNNGLNGFMGINDGFFSDYNPVTFNFTNIEVSASNNGSYSGNGEGDGFSYGLITINGGSLTVSNNGNNGLDGGRGNNFGLNATNTTIVDNDNGNYGIHISEKISGLNASLTNCSVTANNNGTTGVYSLQPLDITGGTLEATNNGQHGLYLSGASTFNGANINNNNNGYAGIYAYNDLTVDGNSVITLSGNNAEPMNTSNMGALDIRGNTTIDSGATLQISNNYLNGIYVYSTSNSLNLGTGTITGNGINNPEYGGGIYNKGTTALSDDVRIYNNNSSTKGDDIYNTEGASITIPTVASGEILTYDGDTDATNNQAITHWFYDGWYPDYEGQFGEAGKTHGWEKDAYAKVYDSESINGSTSTEVITAETALKAAYGPTTQIQPVDLTIYKGGEGYENVDGSNDTVNGFPELGFNVTLTDQMNADIAADESLSNDLSTDTSGVQLRYYYLEDGQYRIWNLSKYADGSSMDENGHYVYALNLENSSTRETVYPKLYIRDGDTMVSTDDFDISNAVYEQYQMEIGSADSAQFDEDTILANVQYKTGDKIVDVDCTTDTLSATLTVRGVTNPTEDNTITDVVEGDATPVENTPLAVVPEGTEFYINGNEGMITPEEESPALLFDEILPEGDDLDNSRRIDWLTQKAEAIREAGDLLTEAGITNPQYDFKYMDIVDQNNGNVVLTASNEVTIYMPYPEGVDKNDEMILLHYKDLDREIAYDDVESAIMNSQVSQVEIKKLDDLIEFTTDSFSPFVLIWGAETTTPPTDPTTPVDPEQPVDDSTDIIENVDNEITTSPDTGVENHTAVMLALIVVSTTLLVAEGYRRYKKRA